MRRGRAWVFVGAAGLALALLGQLEALGPMAADVEMNQNMDAIVAKLQAIPEYRTLFKISFGDEGITVPNIAKAIATFERTVVNGIAPFDK